jgi:hypothetical protein
MNDDRNSLAFWFPKIAAAGLRVPATRIIRANDDLVVLLDGEKPPGWDDLVDELVAAGNEVGWPAFLRTGHGSGKHEWDRTCFLPGPSDVAHHIAALVEWSCCVDMFGLPTDVWAVREMLPAPPLFRCEGYCRFPVTREFRLFVRDGRVEHVQPYWPPDAVEQGRPSDPDWRTKLERASALTQPERAALELIAATAGQAVGGGYWSVDLLEDVGRRWVVTDMAEGDRSFRWEP